MTLPDADGELEKMSDAEKAKAIVNQYKILAAVVIVSFVGYFYLAFGLDWDPVIAIIPVLAVLLPAMFYFYSTLQKLTTGVALPYADDEAKKMGDEEKAKTIANPFIIITAVIIVSLVEYFYIASGLYWDPVVATIPLLAVAIPLGYYIDGKIQKIYPDRKKYSITLWTIILILIICSGITEVIDHHLNKFTFIVKMSLLIPALVLAFIYIRKRAQESVQPSEDSYNSLLKNAIAVIVIDILIIAGCFVLGTIYGAPASLLMFVLAVVIISIWYFVSKARSLGFMS